MMKKIFLLVLVFCAANVQAQTARALIGKDTIPIRRDLNNKADSARNNAGVFEFRKNGVFVPQFPFPSFSTPTLQNVTTQGKVTTDTITAPGFSLPSFDGLGGRFNITSSETTFWDGVKDQIMNIGYNIKNSNTENPALPSNGIQIETNYVDISGGPKTNEWFTTMSAPNGRFTKRPIFVKYDQSNGKVIQEFYADQFIVGAKDSTVSAAGSSPFFVINNTSSPGVLSAELKWSPNRRYNSMFLNETGMMLDRMSLNIRDTSVLNYAEISLTNNNNRSFNIRHKGTGSGNAGKLEISHSSGKYLVIDSSGFIGSNTSPDYSFHAVTTGTAGAVLKLEATGTGNAGIVLTNGGSFAYDMGSNTARDFYMYSGRAGVYPLWIKGTNGNFGFNNVTNPTAKVHLGAGTATANTAPFKFTSGTNLTTPEAGSMEYNGTNLFFSPSTTRNNILMTASVNSVSPTSPNRTITIVVDGLTYYLSAKTTND